jgi:hypothetical protein
MWSWSDPRGPNAPWGAVRLDLVELALTPLTVLVPGKIDGT